MKNLLLVLAMAMLVVVSFSVKAQDPDPSLILSLSFDEGDGDIAEDASKYGNNGEIKGGPEWVNGKFERALLLDGTDDFVQVPHAEILCADEEVTVMAWINAERHTGPGGQNWQGILSKGNSPRSYSLYTEVGQALHFSTAGAGTVSTTKVPLNEWVHIAAVVVEGKHIYYINGEPAGEGGSGIKLPGVSDTADVLVGKTHEGSREFLGMIDEVRIWNRALDADEIKDQMDAGSGGAAVQPQSKLATTWAEVKK